MTKISWKKRGEAGKEIEYSRGQIVFKQGSRAHSFFVILSGSIELQFDGKTRRILKDGDFFGEIGIIAGLERTATATCLENTKMLEFSADEFHQMVKEDPDVEKEILRKFRSRLLHYRTRRDQNMMQTKDEVFDEFLSYFDFHHFRAGDVLCREGEEGGKLFFVLNGRVAIRKNGKPVAERGPGEFVGEIAALQLVSRIADVEAIEDAEVLSCPADRLADLLKTYRPFDQYLRGLASKRAFETFE